MDITVNRLKQLIQSSHVNFLYGSGLSKPYLETLGNIETLLTDVSKSNLNTDEKTVVIASLFAKYYSTVMEPCLDGNIKLRKNEFDYTLSEYTRFLETINYIISKREVNLLNKQINLFTTNIDDLMEKAAEKSKVEFNNGFKGYIKPIFCEDRFSNIVSKTSALYHNNSAIPVFNLFKIHGSINWGKDNESSDIVYNNNLDLIRNLSILLHELPQDAIIDIDKDSTVETLKIKAEDILLIYNSSIYDAFIQEYSKLVMINPTKEKFRTTVLDYHFYELMRMYSNALECASTILIVAGFSFADEHIANITKRAANANPTLQIIVFAYNKEEKERVQNNLQLKGIFNNNIAIISPEDYKRAIKLEDPNSTEFEALEKFDLESLNNYVFSKLTTSI